MKRSQIWKVILCSDCREPFRPDTLHRYGSQLLCPECEYDLVFLNPERFDESA